MMARSRFFIRILAFCVAVISVFFLLYSLVGNYFSAKDPLVFVFDLSYRMNVMDVKSVSGTYISRLDLAKRHVYDSIDRYPESLFSVVILADTPRVMIPLTSDTGSLLLAVDGLVANKGLSGIDFENFLQSYGESFGTRHRLIVFSDFTALGSSQLSCRTCVFVGMGTSAGGYLQYANGAFYRDHGKKVLHKFDVDHFVRLAKDVKAKYVHSSSVDPLSLFFRPFVVDVSHYSLVFIVLLVLSFVVLI